MLFLSLLRLLIVRKEGQLRYKEGYMKFKIKKTQLTKAINRFKKGIIEGTHPRARIETDIKGWIVEVEHLENNGESKLKSLFNLPEEGDYLSFECGAITGHSKGNQYYIKNYPQNGTYLLQINVRNWDESNAFPMNE